jgi:RNA polymerase sigma-70 factor, ECF subfamily
MPPNHDPEILKLAKSGDRNAFRTLVETHQGFAYSLAFRITGDKMVAEDIVQEAFIRFWKHLQDHKPEIKISTWLYRVICNLCNDHFRSDKSKGMWDVNDVKMHGLQDRSEPENEVQKMEMQEAIVSLSGLLTPKQRMVFVLRDIEDMDVAEVCKTLSMSAGNVKSNLYYARMKMAELLKNYYSESKKTQL